MARREVVTLSLFLGQVVLSCIGGNSVRADIHPTGGIFEPPSPPVTAFAVQLHRMPIKSALPKGIPDLTLPENGGVAPNGTVYPQICGNDSLTTYWNSLERIVAPQQRNSGSNIQYPAQQFYVLNVRQARHRFHTDSPYNGGSIIWGYDGIYPGPTFISKYGVPILVRIINGLYDDPAANAPTPDLSALGEKFGDPRISTHLHNGHTGSESDGNPVDFYPPTPPPGVLHLPPYPASIMGIRFRDHHYPMFRAGLDRGRPVTMPAPHVNDGDISESISTLWYHDHSMDHTSENVYKGLVGFHLMFDEVDSNNENDTAPGALRLPSGDFDVPLLFQDKRFSADGQLYFNQLGGNAGRLGDRFAVNGTIQPKFSVLRRKYRFRLLNAGPSRFYQFFLSKNNVDQTFKRIGNDESLLEKPLDIPSVLLGVAERADVVIDFANFAVGDQLYLVNRLKMQDNGQGPQFGSDGRMVVVPADQQDQIVRFDVSGEAPDDPSRLPATLRANPVLPSDLLNKTQAELKSLDNHRSKNFVLDKSSGIWVINDRAFDDDLRETLPRQGPPGGAAPYDGEVWTIKNNDPGWSHPIHIHLEEFRILLRNGVIAPATEQCRKDVLIVGPDEEVQIFLRFRDFLGKYPIHCHNVVHEDHSMMMRFDVVR